MRLRSLKRGRERMWDGVRCDIDDKSAFLSLVSPWLNVRSQWKGGTTNATKSLWQLDPWERKYPFNQMLLLLCAPFFPNLLPISFLPSCFLSCPIHLFLTFGFLYIISGTTNCFWPLCSPFPLHTHKDTEADTQPSFYWWFPWTLDLMSQIGNKNAIKRTPENPHSAFVPPPL